MKQVCLFLLLFFFACSKDAIVGNNPGGTNDEVGSAVIFEPDGETPAGGVTVKVFDKDAEDGQCEMVQTTNSDGRYWLSGLPKGMYNIWAQRDSLVTFQCSVVVTPTVSTARDDTLACPSTITGVVGVQPQDDPRTVTIQVVGLDKFFNNTDKDGRFTMKNMAKGAYSLLLKSTQPNYTLTTAEVSVDACKSETIADTLWLIYTGIPIVTGLAAWYDTSAGEVHLKWNSTDYRNLQAYLIYRDFYDSVNFSTSPIKAQDRDSTVFVDRIFNPQSLDGPFSFSDTNDYHFRYRVAIRNNLTEIGQTFRYVDVVAVPPSRVNTAFSFSTRHIAKGYVAHSSIDFNIPAGGPRVKVSGCASINDSMVITASVSNPARGLKRLVWRDNEAGREIRTVELDTTQRLAVDSMTYMWATQGRKTLICSVADIMGAERVDTVRIDIIADIPKIILGLRDSGFVYSDTILFGHNDTALLHAYVALGDTIRLHAVASDSFGFIADIKWVFGGSYGASTGRPAYDTFAIAPTVAQPNYVVIAQAINDDGNTASDSVEISANLFAPVMPHAGFSGRMYHTSLEFNNAMWIFGGGSIIYDTLSSDFTCTPESWYSADGVRWTMASNSLPVRAGQTFVVFNGKIVMIGGLTSGKGELKKDVWRSSDGVVWTCLTDSTPFTPRCFHSSAVYNNKLWIIGGIGTAGKLRDAWWSEDGVTWAKATDSAAFSARSYHTSCVFDNKLWVIAGQDTSDLPLNDVWCSVDGIIWTQPSADSWRFAPRRGHTSLVYDNKLWVIGGCGISVNNVIGDAWNSSDGVLWTRVSDCPGFDSRAFHSSMVFHKRMWVIAGAPSMKHYLNDVWRSGPLQ